MKSIRELVSDPDSRADLQSVIALVLGALGMIAFIWLNSGAPVVQVGPVKFGIPSPTPTATPEPLSCKFVRVPGRPVGADFCTMPDGTKCLFDRGSEPAVCYTVKANGQ